MTHIHGSGEGSSPYPFKQVIDYCTRPDRVWFHHFMTLTIADVRIVDLAPLVSTNEKVWDNWRHATFVPVHIVLSVDHTESHHGRPEQNSPIPR